MGAARRFQAGEARGQRIQRPRIGLERKGAVENQPLQVLRVSEREYLREERAVGLAVEIDGAGVDALQHGFEVVDCGNGSEIVGAWSENLAALRDRLGRERLVGRRAVDAVGRARTAIVDEQEIVIFQCQRERAVCPRVLPHRRIAGTAVHHDDRAR